MDYVYDPDALYHYGIPGMKWGVKKAAPISRERASLDTAKANYKSAKKAYRKSFNNAYNKSIAAYSPSKKHRKANTERWVQAIDDANKLNRAKKEYKQKKQERKAKIKSAYKDINTKSSLKSKLIYNNATRKKAAAYVVDHNMSYKDAVKKAEGNSRRNTMIFIGTYAAASVGYSAYKKVNG